MNHKKTLIVLAVIMMIAVPVSILMSNESDARVSIDDDKIWGQGFTNSSDGTLYITFWSDEYNEQRITITVTTESGKKFTDDVVVPARVDDPITYTAKMGFRLSSVGTHTLTVTCESENPVFLTSGGTSNIYSTTVDVNVTESMLSKPTTYIAIAVIAIMIVVAAFLYMRNAPAKKPDTTFTELDKQKKESREEVEEAPKTSATERKRYRESDSRPKETAKPSVPPEEKKATPSTNPEKQKKEKKEAVPQKKETSSEEPKKLKYVSSRRK
ncbi:MAG: hypothetical protein FWC29_02530 [Methanomassiliicoccaceae archaeon]|nr:hypothetical protein [Methanomassiliicoccaceae archaeon]